MKYETYSPGNGYTYPFVWCWTDEFPNYPDKEMIYISLDTGRHTSYTFGSDPTVTYVAEKCQCSVEDAAAIQFFIKEKFRERADLRAKTKNNPGK